MARSHRRERSESRISRRQGKKRSYDRMLIVCEGEKTEVNYFTAIRREKRLPNADVKIVPAGYGTAPMQIVEYAIDHFLELKSFDRVYVVFDRDDHASYNDALSKALATHKTLKNDEGVKISFVAVPSVPNFELWILLHFREVFDFMPRDIIFTQLCREEYYPTYSKNSTTVYQDTKEQIPLATNRAEVLRARYNAFAGDEPYTDVDLLTGELLKIAERLQ